MALPSPSPQAHLSSPQLSSAQLTPPVAISLLRFFQFLMLAVYKVCIDSFFVAYFCISALLLPTPLPPPSICPFNVLIMLSLCETIWRRFSTRLNGAICIWNPPLPPDKWRRTDSIPPISFAWKCWSFVWHFLQLSSEIVDWSIDGTWCE